MNQLLYPIFIAIVIDKILTYIIILKQKKYYPKSDYIQVEKNLLFRYLFRQLGLIEGTIASAFISAGLFLIWFKIFKMYAVYVFLFIYAWVLINNILKLSTLISKGRRKRNERTNILSL